MREGPTAFRAAKVGSCAPDVTTPCLTETFDAQGGFGGVVVIGEKAYKCCPLTNLDQEVNFKREYTYFETFKNHTHLNLVKYDTICKQDALGVIVMPKEEGDLFTWLMQNTGPELQVVRSQRTRAFKDQIGSALNYLHRHGWCHCDVKPENILQSGETMKLADFGHMLMMNTANSNARQVGTAPYAPPTEMIDALIERSDISLAHFRDKWAFSVCLYTLNTGKFAPWIRQRKETIEPDKSSFLTFLETGSTSEDPFVKKMSEVFTRLYLLVPQQTGVKRPRPDE